MTVNVSAYDTTACSAFAISKVKAEIEKAKLMAGLHRVEVRTDAYSEPAYLYLVEGGNASADTVPFFKHPLPLGQQEGQGSFAVDVRDFGKWVAPQASFAVRNGVEYTWHLKRAVLNVLWQEGRAEVLRDISTLPMAAYAQLIARSVARRFALDPAQQMTVAALAGFFYQCLFTDDHSVSESEHPYLLGKISTVLHLPLGLVTQALTGLQRLHTLDELCVEIHKRVDTAAMENFNVGTLLMVTTGNWFGTNSREVVAVGLEHIPTWLMIVEASLSSATFKRSTLAKIVQELDKKDAGKNFCRSLEVLMGGKQAVSDQGVVNTTYATHF